MFKDVYTHRVGKAIDYMIVDCLYEANPVYHFEQMITDPKQYINLTDDILTLIEV